MVYLEGEINYWLSFQRRNMRFFTYSEEGVSNFHVSWKQAGWWRASTGTVRCRKRSLTNCFGESAGRCRDHIPTNWSRSRAVGNAARDTPHDGRGPAHTFAATGRQRCRLSTPVYVPHNIPFQAIMVLTACKRLNALWYTVNSSIYVFLDKNKPELLPDLLKCSVNSYL